VLIAQNPEEGPTFSNAEDPEVGPMFTMPEPDTLSLMPESAMTWTDPRLRPPVAK
jgi:hypothetical protein